MTQTLADWQSYTCNQLNSESVKFLNEFFFFFFVVLPCSYWVLLSLFFIIYLAVIKEQKQYLKQLEDLMTDKNTLDIRYLKTFLVGPPGVGKTTTLNRLLKLIINICTAGDRAKVPSTLLANCIQVFVFVSSDGTQWVSSSDLNQETLLLFRYLCGHKLEEVPHKRSSSPRCQSHRSRSERITPERTVSQGFNFTQTVMSMNVAKEVAHTKEARIHSFITRLQKVILSEGHSTLLNLLGSTLINIYDIGGQPGFLEMLPALSSGPAMYLVFFDLSKKLDEPFKIPFSRDDTVITPYDALHTVEATLSQILSSITSVHCISGETNQLNFTKAEEFREKFERFQAVKPVAILIGTHKDQLKHNTEQELENTNKSLNSITSRYSKVICCPDVSKCFFAVDNVAGTDDVDVGPIRNFISTIFQSHFKDASLPIRPNWLWFSLVLRREFRIVSMIDCLKIAKLFKMDKNEIEFALWYLHFCTGTLMYYPTILDDWFQNHIICSPQVVFDSISQLIIASLRTLHTEGPFTDHERKEMIQIGQFSMESIEKYSSCYQVKQNLEKVQLIPPKQLVKLLEHVNLLSPIIHKEGKDERITYFMPAILECASPDMLTPQPLPDDNHPEALFITFGCGYVPTGSFCGLITRLVSLGPHRILGLSWKLLENGVRRNCVSFYVAGVNKVTLICHETSFELRLVRSHSGTPLHDLCVYVLSVLLYTLKILYKQLKVEVAFPCPCPNHESKMGLCKLTDENFVLFVCQYFKKPVTLRSGQQVWLGKVRVCLLL